jgi:CubicO group peptidase (beta-lactamase class C family)
MGRIVATEYVSLDGVVEAPGGFEDFKHAGWVFEFDRGSEADDTKTYYSTDLRELALNCRIEGKPGEYFEYNYNPLLVGLIPERATGMSVSRYMEEKLWKPMGMEADGSWSLDRTQSGFEKMESGVNVRARDFARFGMLFARAGDWEGRQLISRG